MISWMQKHNKYLVWTIWVATIAFIGAGFVGWGSYDLSSKAGSVAKVGEISITQQKLNMVYSTVYSQYNQMFQGKLDEKKAKEMGLIGQAFSSIESQAKILNFAKDAGIIASDTEVLSEIQAIKAFQDKGIFNQELYDNYLRSQRLKAQAFESTMREELIVRKTLALLENNNSTELEINTIAASMNVADKFAYKVLTSADINYVSDESKVKAFWEKEKENYLTQKTFDLSLAWTESQGTEVSESELKAYHEKNSFNYTNKEGKQLSFEDAKEKVSKDVKLNKSKKAAQIAYISFKKGQIKDTETITLPLGDKKLTGTIWNDIQTKSVGDITKAKIVGDQYVSVKINKINLPQVKTYEAAKAQVSAIFDNKSKKEALMKHAEATLKTLDANVTTTPDFVLRTSKETLNPLNSQESLQFLQKLFTSTKEKGIISVADKVVAYHITEQKILSMDGNQTERVKQTVTQMKKNILQTNLVKMLDKQYPTEVYMKGLKN